MRQSGPECHFIRRRIKVVYAGALLVERAARKSDCETFRIVVSVSLGNIDELVQMYRVLSLQIQIVDPDSANASIDINESGLGDGNDWVMLTLSNGTVDMFIDGGDAASGNFTVRVKKGFFVTQVHPGAWPGGASASPDLFAEVAQR